ncbi:MAG: FG-GAP-like repeat-containing protein [Gemmataceae bacterium]
MYTFRAWPWNHRRPVSSRRVRPLRPLERLETREVPATSIIAVGADASGGPRVTLYDRATSAVTADFFAYDPKFAGGVRVAVADFNGDGNADVVTAPGPGGGPHIKIFDGQNGKLINEFFAYDAGFVGGVNVAAADVNGDGKAEIITGAGTGGGPHVRVFEASTGRILKEFFAYDSKFSGGVNVAAADVTGDGKADVITGPGKGMQPLVRVFDGTSRALVRDFNAYDSSFTGGVYVAATDLTADGHADIVTGAGAGGGPHVKIFDGETSTEKTSFFAYDASFTGGVRVATFSLDNTGRPGIATVGGPGAATQVRIFTAPGGQVSSSFTAFDTGFRGGAFVGAYGLNAALGQLSDGALGNFFQPKVAATGQTILTLHLKPLDINLLGLEVQTSDITVTVTVDTGDGLLLGNLLSVVANLVNLQGVNTALDNVLGSVVDLLNSASLNVGGVNTSSGPLSNATAATTPLLNLFVAPVHLNLLGARVDTSPITLTLTAHSGQGLVLGNVLADLANLLNPPLPNTLTLDTVNQALANLLDQLNTQIPGIGSSPTVIPTPSTGTEQILRLTLPPIDLNLLGLVVQTTQIQVNADAQTGDGLLLGNVLTTLLNTLGATPDNLNTLNNNLNALLAKVIGVLNASNLTLGSGAVAGLTPVLQQLALPNLVNTSGSPASAQILDLTIASTDGTSPPVDVDLLGLLITTSNIHAQLLAQTGDGQILGNLLYNVAHLLDPGGSLNLLNILNLLAL